MMLQARWNFQKEQTLNRTLIEERWNVDKRLSGPNKLAKDNFDHTQMYFGDESEYSSISEQAIVADKLFVVLQRNLNKLQLNG